MTAPTIGDTMQTTGTTHRRSLRALLITADERATLRLAVVKGEPLGEFYRRVWEAQRVGVRS